MCFNGYFGNGVMCMGKYIGKWRVFFKLEIFKVNWIKRIFDLIFDLININILYFVIVIKVVIKFYVSIVIVEIVYVLVRIK